MAKGNAGPNGRKKAAVPSVPKEMPPAGVRWQLFAGMGVGVLAAVVGFATVHSGSAREAPGGRGGQTAVDPAGTPARQDAAVLAGYVPEYRLGHVEGNIVRIAPYVTDVILFSVHPSRSGDVAFEPGIGKDQLRFAKVAKAAGAKRVLLSVGGGGRSDNFDAVSRSASARKKLAGRLLQLCREYGLDGIDIDWEIPQTPQQKKQLALLLQDVRAALSPDGLLLTVALHYWDIPSPEVVAAVDRIHFMTYDFVQQPGGHASFKASKQAIEALLAQGIPAAKVVMGVPAYARSKSDVRTLSELHDIAKLGDDVNKHKGFYFNGRNQVQKKARWALEKGLGGVFIWELGQDSLEPEKGILTALHSELAGGAGEAVEDE
eukprot:TRINITY_DN26332_c0_g1_i1.p1 TRINITY_DN26332_c0_g1~~TRINITY_DN26332_c0_g1_i1.p1  ORF type:complete len:386 (+),score=107.45 TRINITY_DN26332_c0_g1_i1:34-1158(+)